MKDNYLFRREVFENRKNKNYGTVFINLPLSFKWICISIFFLVVGLCLFLCLGEYSEKFVVRGYLESNKGLVRVYPQKEGIIQESYIKPGAHMKQGDPLFLVDTSSEMTTKHDHDDLLEPLEKNKKIMEEQLAYKKRYLKSLKHLLNKKFISLTTYHEAMDEMLTLEQQKVNLEMQIIQYKHTNAYVVRAPIDGVISSVLYHQGQRADRTKPLTKLLPNDANWVAELFIPVSQSGFIQANNPVIIRYDAYPFTQFGTTKATIREIDRSILTDEEENNPIRIGQPYYKAMAILDKQVVSVYGKEKKIQQGMTISAVIMGSRRKLWQWILDPLYSFYGGVFR